MLKLNNIMLLSQSSTRNLTENGITGQLEFSGTFTLNDADNRPWTKELTVDITASIVNENTERVELMHAQNIYAVSFTEDPEDFPSEIPEAVWPYVRPDVVSYFHTYSLPADSVPLFGATAQDNGN